MGHFPDFPLKVQVARANTHQRDRAASHAQTPRIEVESVGLAKAVDWEQLAEKYFLLDSSKHAGFDLFLRGLLDADRIAHATLTFEGVVVRAALSPGTSAFELYCEPVDLDSLTALLRVPGHVLDALHQLTGQ